MLISSFQASIAHGGAPMHASLVFSKSRVTLTSLIVPARSTAITRSIEAPSISMGVLAGSSAKEPVAAEAGVTAANATAPAPMVSAASAARRRVRMCDPLCSGSVNA